MFFSTARFIRDIVEGDGCFVCGASQGSKSFNNEHIIPDWILREFNLHARRVTLPNGASVIYGKYTVPCCEECNSALGEIYERPVRELLSKGHNDVGKHLETQGSLLLFTWLALIFLKTHLKDRHYRFNVDRREPEGAIGDLYDYALVHHIHCLIRAPFTGAVIEKEVFGSMFAIATRYQPHLKEDKFDFCDSFESRTVLLRYHDTGLVVALDDSCGAHSLFWDNFMKITGAVVPSQLREIHAHIAFLSANLEVRPKFRSVFSGSDHCISAFRAENPSLKHPPEIQLGEFLLNSFEPILNGHPDRERILESIRQERWSFLFDANGKFIVD